MLDCARYIEKTQTETPEIHQMFLKFYVCIQECVLILGLIFAKSSWEEVYNIDSML
jgi:hypothetical protein